MTSATASGIPIPRFSSPPNPFAPLNYYTERKDAKGCNFALEVFGWPDDTKSVRIQVYPRLLTADEPYSTSALDVKIDRDDVDPSMLLACNLTPLFDAAVNQAQKPLRKAIERSNAEFDKAIAASEANSYLRMGKKLVAQTFKPPLVEGATVKIIRVPEKGSPEEQVSNVILSCIRPDNREACREKAPGAPCCCKSWDKRCKIYSDSQLAVTIGRPLKAWGIAKKTNELANPAETPCRIFHNFRFEPVWAQQSDCARNPEQPTILNPLPPPYTFAPFRVKLTGDLRKTSKNRATVTIYKKGDETKPSKKTLPLTEAKTYDLAQLYLGKGSSTFCVTIGLNESDANSYDFTLPFRRGAVCTLTLDKKNTAQGSKVTPSLKVDEKIVELLNSRSEDEKIPTSSSSVPTSRPTERETLTLPPSAPTTPQRPPKGGAAAAAHVLTGPASTGAASLASSVAGSSVTVGLGSAMQPWQG